MKDTQSNPIATWWKDHDNINLDKSLISTINSVQDAQMGIQTRNRMCERLYQLNGSCFGGLYSSKLSPSPYNTSVGFMQNGPRRNIVNSVINTVVARLVASGTPDVSFLTEQGDHELQHKSKLLQLFYEGLSYQTDLDAESIKALRDACIFGIGTIKFCADSENNIFAERVHPNKIWVDILDGEDQKPRSLYHVYLVDKDVLAANFEDKAKEILKLKTYPTTVRSDFASNRVAVYEAWHLPSNESADDGRHVMCCEGIVLVNDEYSEMNFPFAFIRYDGMVSGFLGHGLSDLLRGHQISLNEVIAAEYWAHSQVSMPRLWLDINSKINRNHANSSKSGLIMEGQGNPPQVLNWTATTPNLVQYKQWIIEDAHEFAGVSLLSASGKKPAGLDSGASQREYMDIQSDRFSILSDAWGRFYVDCAKRMVHLAKDVYSRNKGLSVKVIGKNFIKTIKWKDCDLDEEEYHLQLWATNKLPRTPAGRLAAITELAQAGILTPAQSTRLLEYPDLDEEMSLQNAAEDNAHFIADQMLYEGKFTPPDPLQDLATCVNIVQEAAIVALTNNAPQERINLCRRWLTQARLMLQPPPPPVTQPLGSPAPVGPTANPAPAPTSSLLPQGN